jgi:hypothetical protein
VVDVSDQQIEQLQRWARRCRHQALLATTIIALDQREPVAFVATGEVINSIAVYELAPCSRATDPRVRDEARRYVAQWLTDHPGYRKELLAQELGFDEPPTREPTEPQELGFDQPPREREPTEPLTLAECPRRLRTRSSPSSAAAETSSSWREVLGGMWPALDSVELLALARVRYERRVSGASAVDVAALREAMQAAAAELAQP